MTTRRSNGQLVPDAGAGEWSMPWNATDGVGRLGPGIPKSDFWASVKEGIDQVGCVYTAQGFEFDYVVEETSFLVDIAIAIERIGRVTGRWARA